MTGHGPKANTYYISLPCSDVLQFQFLILDNFKLPAVLMLTKINNIQGSYKEHVYLTTKSKQHEQQFLFLFYLFSFSFFFNLQIHPAGQVEPYSSQLWRAGPYMVGWGYVANQVSILPYFPLISLSNIILAVGLLMWRESNDLWWHGRHLWGSLGFSADRLKISWECNEMTSTNIIHAPNCPKRIKGQNNMEEETKIINTEQEASQPTQAKG